MDLIEDSIEDVDICMDLIVDIMVAAGGIYLHV